MLLIWYIHIHTYNIHISIQWCIGNAHGENLKHMLYLDEIEILIVFRNYANNFQNIIWP